MRFGSIRAAATIPRSVTARSFKTAVAAKIRPWAKAPASTRRTASGNVYIGTGVPGVAGENDACYIASIFNQTSASGAPVFINANNKLGTSTSSKRFKDNIQPMNEASDSLFSLRPVTFRYKPDIDPDQADRSSDLWPRTWNK